MTSSYDIHVVQRRDVISRHDVKLWHPASSTTWCLSHHDVKLWHHLCSSHEVTSFHAMTSSYDIIYVVPARWHKSNDLCIWRRFSPQSETWEWSGTQCDGTSHIAHCTKRCLLYLPLFSWTLNRLRKPIVRSSFGTVPPLHSQTLKLIITGHDVLTSCISYIIYYYTSCKCY